MNNNIKRQIKRAFRIKDDLLYSYSFLNSEIKKSVQKLKKNKQSNISNRCFIIGSGPSIKKQNLSLLKNEITFGFNAFYLIKDEIGFLPTYYLIEDPFPAEDNADVINKLEGTTIIVPYDLKYCIKPRNNVIYVNFDRVYLNPIDKLFPHFANNCEKKVYWGGTVAYMALQIADYLNYKDIYLLGIDLTYSWPKNHVSDSITSKGSDSDHFHPDYFGKGKRWHDPKVERMQKSFSKAYKHFKRYDKNLFNATLGGNLMDIPRSNFNEILTKRDVK